MSKQKDSKHNLPNVVAKLMGLEAPPRGEANFSSSMERSHRREYYSQQMYGPIGLPFKPWQHEDRFMDSEMLLHEVHPSTEHVSYKDMYEIWQQQPQRASHVVSEDVDGKRMALIRQKFMEAKRLSTDERTRQSEQFKDALEVLSSNSDLLIRLLDSQSVCDLYSASPNESTKRITLIKPLKMVDNDKSARKEKKKSRLQVKKEAASVDHGNSRDSSESPVRTTRIVLLKPSPEQKPVVSPTTTSPNDVLESIRGQLRSYHHQKDKTPHSSVFSNGYSDDEKSSFNKSCHHENFSDLEAMLSMSPWDYNYINGCCGSSPYSTMSLGRVPCSPESSVCREAKKRLSERWTMMTSDNKEQRQARRSSTLGEMLSLAHKKKSLTTSEVESSVNEEPGKSVSFSHSFNAETSIVNVEDSHKNLPRSNSVPASSTTVYENGSQTVVEVNGSQKVQKKKSKGVRSSFKGKVASFLFSRSKKSSTKEKEKPSLSSQSKDESQSTTTVTETLVLRDDVSQSSINVNGFEECCSLAALSDSVYNGQEEDMITLEPGLKVPRAMMPEIINSSENPDQPSPISVLQPPFEDYNNNNNNASHESLDCMKSADQGSQVPLKSNLIDKSPPIESIARSLSWDDDDSSEELRSPYSLKPLMVSSLDSKVEDQEWLLLVHKLLSAAGLDDQHVHQQHNSSYTRWHSLESPLDPSLRDTLYANNLSEKEPMHEGRRRRKMRSNHKLVYDYVNAALLELVGCYDGSEKKGGGALASPLLVMDHIVAQMKELIASGVRCCEWENGGGDSSTSLVVENVVRKEVVQIGWVQLMELEIDILGKEIEGDLIQELVENAVVESLLS